MVTILTASRAKTSPEYFFQILATRKKKGIAKYPLTDVCYETAEEEDKAYAKAVKLCLSLRENYAITLTHYKVVNNCYYILRNWYF